jgi:hypothetical protein
VVLRWLVTSNCNISGEALVSEVLSRGAVECLVVAKCFQVKDDVLASHCTSLLTWYETPRPRA